MIDACIALTGRVVAVLNTGSGSCDPRSKEKADAIFRDAGLNHVEIVSVDASAVIEELKAAVDRADVLIVLGGDGTIGAAATFCGEYGPLLIPLPGGTMNMLPKALYATSDWEAALKAVLHDPAVQNVSGGTASGHRFYCAAILGAPSLWADAREAVRHGDIVEAAKRAITAARRSLSDAIDYEFEDQKGSAEAVAVICPLISLDMQNDEASLEAVAVDPATAAGLFGLAFHSAFDSWRNDESVTRAKVQSVDVRAHGEIPVILDGEKVKIDRIVEVSFVPLAFRAIVPRRDQSKG